MAYKRPTMTELEARRRKLAMDAACGDDVSRSLNDVENNIAASAVAAKPGDVPEPPFSVLANGFPICQARCSDPELVGALRRAAFLKRGVRSVVAIMDARGRVFDVTNDDNLAVLSKKPSAAEIGERLSTALEKEIKKL